MSEQVLRILKLAKKQVVLEHLYSASLPAVKDATNYCVHKGWVRRRVEHVPQSWDSSTLTLRHAHTVTRLILTSATPPLGEV